MPDHASRALRPPGPAPETGEEAPPAGAVLPMARCTCGQPASYGPSTHNGSRRSLCTGCYHELPVARRHLWEPAPGATAEAHGGFWIGHDPL